MCRDQWHLLRVRPTESVLKMNLNTVRTRFLQVMWFIERNDEQNKSNQIL